MKFWIILLILSAASSVFADTTVYETNEGGIPTFTNLPQSSDESAKKIVIPDAPEPNQSAVSPSNKLSPSQDDQVAQQLQSIDATEQQLKNQLELTTTNVEQAQQNLDDAQKAMATGTYRVGNNEYIDQDYIHNLKESLANAKQQNSIAQQAYDSYRNQHK